MYTGDELRELLARVIETNPGIEEDDLIRVAKWGSAARTAWALAENVLRGTAVVHVDPGSGPDDWTFGSKS